jgi:hypothetical protein
MVYRAMLAWSRRARLVDTPDLTGLLPSWRSPRRFDLRQNERTRVLYINIEVIRLRWEPNMARYVARFMKNVLGENGHEAEICQRSIEIEAASRGHAVELAKREFCEAENLKDWALHADCIRVADAEFPS